MLSESIKASNLASIAFTLLSPVDLALVNNSTNCFWVASAEAASEAKVEVTKVDMRKKENKLSTEDKAQMDAIMDSIVGTDD